jgi:phosphoesterase RecJ-like protein
VDQADVYRRIEQAERTQKLALLCRALDSLELVADGRIALMHLHAADFVQTGAWAEETERFIDVPQMVASVEAVVLAVETLPGDPNGAASRSEGGGVRLSFRSKVGPDAMNVAELAARFGGGGHARAAGAKLAGPLDAVLDQVRTALVAAV